MMPNSDPRDEFFNPTLTLMIDSYIMPPARHPVVSSVARSMAVIILLFIVSSTVWRFCDRSLFCYAARCVLSSSPQSSRRGRESWLLYFYFLLAVLRQLLFLPLPHGAVAWSAVCDCGISWSYSLTFSASYPGMRSYYLTFRLL